MASSRSRCQSRRAQIDAPERRRLIYRSVAPDPACAGRTYRVRVGATSGRVQVGLNFLDLAAAVTDHHHRVRVIVATMRHAPIVPVIRQKFPEKRHNQLPQRCCSCSPSISMANQMPSRRDGLKLTISYSRECFGAVQAYSLPDTHGHNVRNPCTPVSKTDAQLKLTFGELCP
jgi:hypothetical protein